jgi:hypothetical protein
MIDALRHRLAQHRESAVTIPGRSEHAGAGELHGAIAEPLHGAVAEDECAGLVDAGHDLSPVRNQVQIGLPPAR